MEFVILGPTALYFAGKAVPLGVAKQRGMLAVLLYHIGEPVPADSIVEHLWDSPAGTDRRANLYALASRIRAVLDRVGIRDALIRINAIGAYQLNIDPDLIDFHRFRRLVAQARQTAEEHREEACTDLLNEAIALWRYEPLADLHSARSEHLRRHLKETLLDAHKLLTDAQLRTGQYQAALARLEPLIRSYEFDEALAQGWITALCATGREDDARVYYFDFRRRFRRELRVAPAIEMPRAPKRIRLANTPTSAAARTPVMSGPQHLPNDISDFTGRDELLTELDALTTLRHTGSNTVVISGMPGGGKTTLAIHWAHRQRHRFPDGQLYINANAYGIGRSVEPDDVLGRFLRALHVRADRIPTGTDQRRDRLNQVLRDRRMLILLDNVRDAEQVRPLLTNSNTCVTLVTSRNRLRGLTIHEGIRSITVPPLTDPECLALFTHLLTSSRTAAEPEALRALVRLSGGLPLAVRVMGVHIAERPRARIGDLVEGLSTDLLKYEDDEEASLCTVFAWSYNALSAPAAKLFRVLGRYPGLTISPEAAAAMVGSGVPQTEQLLNMLTKVHLLNHDVARRYRFHDLLRLYAAKRADHEESPEQQRNAMRRLLDWYLLSAVNATIRLVPHWETIPDLPQPQDITPQTFPGDLDAMRWYEAERGNLAAVTHAAAHEGFHRHGWQIPGAVHEILNRYGRQDDTLALQELARTSAQLDEHLAGQMGALVNLGTTCYALHDHTRAAENFTAALRLARSVGDRQAEAVSLHNLASVHLSMGDTATAIRMSEQVLAACRAMAYPHGEAAALHKLGDASRQTVQYEQAIAHYLEALAIRERIGYLRGQGLTHGALAAVYLEAGRREQALAHGRRALDIHDHTKDDAALCDALVTVTDVMRELGMLREARRSAERAIATSEEIADSHRRARALAVLADTLAAAGNLGGAHQACKEASDIVAELADPDARAVHDRLIAIKNLLARPAAS